MEIVRTRCARAVAAVAHADVVSQLCGRSAAHHAVGRDPSGVHVGVAVGGRSGAVVTQRLQVRAFRRGHDDAIDGLVARVTSVVHLIEKICGACRTGGRGPIRIGAQVVLGVARLQIKLHDGAVRLRRQDGAIDAVAGHAVAVRSVVKHRRRGKTRGPVHAIINRHRQSIRVFVHDPRADGHHIRRRRKDGSMGYPGDQRSNVGCRNGVGPTGCAVERRARPPVVGIGVGQSRIDQLQRTARATVWSGPFPAQSTVMVERARHTTGAEHARRPVAFGVELDAVDHVTGVVAQLQAVPQSACPAGHEVGHAGMFCGKGRPVRLHDEIAAGNQNSVCRKRKRDAFGDLPTRQVHGGAAGVI